MLAAMLAFLILFRVIRPDDLNGLFPIDNFMLLFFPSLFFYTKQSKESPENTHVSIP